MTETPLLLYDEVAVILRCKKRTVEKMVRDGRLHRVPKVPGAKILRSEVMALLEGPAKKTPRPKARVIEQHI